eukprot:289860-Chlamydomonas_euryale.AAC.1
MPHQALETLTCAQPNWRTSLVSRPDLPALPICHAAWCAEPPRLRARRGRSQPQPTQRAGGTSTGHDTGGAA